MNKRIFTLLTAGLLLGGPAFNAAYAADVDLTDKTVISYSENKTALANGLSFYLGASKTTLLKVTDALKTKDGKEVVSFESTTASEVADATVFTIRNYSSSSFELWANVDGKEYQVAVATDGKDLTSASDKKLSDLQTKFTTATAKLNFKGLYTVTVPTNQVKTDLKAFSYEGKVNADYLNDYNSTGTTLSFDYKTNELVGNLFDKVKPVTFSDEIAETGAGEAKLAAGTYFVSGDSKKVDAFLGKVNAETPVANDILAAAQDVKFLAVNPNPKSRYDINGKQDNEGYSLYWMKGAVATSADSTANAAFTITAKDALNEEGKLTLKVTFKVDEAAAGTEVYVAAVRPSVSDTKTYVTTVLSGESTKTNYTPIHPQLGSNSYLNASVLLKKNVENVVNIYFTSATTSKEDKPGIQTEYHKYLTINPANGSDLSVAAYNNVDFTMPVAQWIVAGFDGKYTFTLKNRETAKELVLRLQPNGEEGGYKVEKATYDGEDVTISGDETSASNGVTDDLALNKTSVKFNTIATTRTDGYKVFTDTQIAEGFKMTFNGKDALFGEKALYAIDDNATKTMKASTKEENLIVLYPERIKGAKDHSTKSLQGVEDYVISTNAFAYLNDKGEVVMKADGDTLVVPTYVLRYTEAKGDDAKYLGAAASRDKAADAATEFAVVKNAAGAYSLVAVSAVTDGKLSYDGSTGSSAKMASVNTTSMAITYAANRYQSADDINKTYANVEVLDANPFNPSLAAKPRHASFDNMLGSINYQLNKNGFNEGILSAESMIFWLDTADSKAKTPSFYISKGIEVAEGEEKPAERMFMFNPTDSLHYFVEGSAQQYTDEKYYLEGSGKSETKVIFRPAILTGVDTITTTVKGETVKVVKELNDDKSVKSTDRLDAFKFNITLAEGDDEYFVSSQRKVKEGDVYKTAYVYALNGMLGLTTNPEKAMVFTLGTEVPTANESIDAKESSIVVVAGNGVVTIQGAAGETAYVRTVLGQTVAETVLTSDNATIAAPAGVVFVTVGNETVKVAVK
ncbi:DUF6383 domain-containing protein [Parabacteroides distasonis]|jgi:hypothetical protein|uniref:DUF6383 domain-containing protein n=1 Tax=Parabacteroides distasonis TaxID=823 RepID=A0AAX3QRF4_PARDI|nr:DUF6383 domain-containing protein [Parabacteroides distasonis]RGT97996.1 hypothetical protein DWX02_02085 [Parabacteroides distasonis]WET63665.1 DUF6383 domain-containing protein [Parabacteroides distasonis]